MGICLWYCGYRIIIIAERQLHSWLFLKYNPCIYNSCSDTIFSYHLTEKTFLKILRFTTKIPNASNGRRVEKQREVTFLSRGPFPSDSEICFVPVALSLDPSSPFKSLTSLFSRSCYSCCPARWLPPVSLPSSRKLRRTDATYIRKSDVIAYL